MTDIFTPRTWYWLVAANNKYWGSLEVAYVNNPDLTKLSLIDTEPNLADVLWAYQLQGPIASQTMTITNYQLRSYLTSIGKLQTIANLIAALAQTDPSALAWASMPNIARNSAFVLYVQTQLSLTSKQIDNSFFAASKIQ